MQLWLLAAAVLPLATTAAFLSVGHGATRQHLHLILASSPTAEDNARGLSGTVDGQIEIVPAGGSFRDTHAGQVSLVSYNALAPSYHSLRLPLDERVTATAVDRQNRLPMSLRIAKQSNADILCLQEVEGGPENLETLRQLLAKEESEHDSAGYDGIIWTPLNPKRLDDVVGLAVAWRTSKHRLLSQNCYRRGMVVQLGDVATNTTVRVANVHLPARPSAIEGRLRFTASTLRRLQECQPPEGYTTGLAIVAGDMNCEQRAPNLRLVETGQAPYGTLRDRNYKMRLSKKAASQMKHNLRFQHVYRQHPECASVTVSLEGRGPGCMDHIYFTPSLPRPRVEIPTVLSKTGKRPARRGRSTGSSRTGVDQVRVAALLATVSEMDTERTHLILKGLPNEAAGFYSDHLPVGALFVPQDARTRPPKVASTTSTSGLSTRAQQRRHTYRQSTSTRSRHNTVLRTVVETLESSFVAPILRDVPLYKWPWIQAVTGLKKKTRAPDLCCVVQDELVIVEVTVVSDKVDQAYQQKQYKYRDVIEALKTAPTVEASQLKVTDVYVIALDETGSLATESKADLRRLVRLCDRNEDAAEKLAQDLQNGVRAYLVPG
jgi:endonuclease/exonuclease/phosphatase family metal-dependent hydrolase